MKIKQKLRNEMKKERKYSDLGYLDENILSQLKFTSLYISAYSLMIYYPIQKEINLLPLLEDKSKQIFFPKISGDEIVPLKYNGEFCLGKYNIKEPLNADIGDIDKLDLVVVPALCVDLNGYRIGYGKGYYDRFIKKLNRKRTKLVVVAYEQFVVDDICPDSFDEKVDFIITEKRVIEL